MSLLLSSSELPQNSVYWWSIEVCSACPKEKFREPWEQDLEKMEQGSSVTRTALAGITGPQLLPLRPSSLKKSIPLPQ